MCWRVVGVCTELGKAEGIKPLCRALVLPLPRGSPTELGAPGALLDQPPARDRRSRINPRSC